VVRQPAAPAAEGRVAGGLPRPPAGPAVPGGIAADVLARRIDEFLTSRGYRQGASQSAAQGPAPAPPAPASSGAPTPLVPPASGAPAVEKPVEKPAEFVCEEDVRTALKQSRKIVIGERSIVTPAARDLGEQHRIFVQASWPR
jgi:hypothetical protein